MAEVVVISGSTAGVGRAVARHFARRGAKVAFLARIPGELRSAAVEVVTLGATAALGIPCDVNDDAHLDAATQRIETELGPIDVWVDVPLAKLQTWDPVAVGATVVALVLFGAVIRRAFRSQQP